MRIDGKRIANKILEDLKIRAKKLREKNIYPKLAIILIGNDSASAAYVKQKELKAASIGIKTSTYNLDSRIQNSELVKLINKLNKDKKTHGIIIQRPLPKQINGTEILKAVDPKKDVDGFHLDSHFQMPIAMAVLEILKNIYNLKEKVYIYTPRVQFRFREWLKSKKIVIIGKGETGGKPIIQMFEKMKLPCVVIDSKTKDPENLTKKADIIISAVGKANILKPQMIKKGVVLIDIGISRGEGTRLMGDYDENEVKNIASFYTPTPGGVGPINVAMLLKNLVKSPDFLLDKS